MNSLIFGLHCAIVFAIPSLFGWVVLRQVFREANLLALLPGSVLVGFAALMALMNEVRYFAEMGVAAWFSYKVLFGLTLLLMIVLPKQRGRPRLPGCADRGWRLALLVLAAIAAGFYYGVPAFGGFLDDAWWGHYPLAVQIQTAERFPLHHMFAVDNPLYYHPGPDILAACWSYLLRQSVQTGFALCIAIIAPCTFLLAFALLARLAHSYWAALLGSAFLIGGGNLRFLLFLTRKFHGVMGALQVFNSQTVVGLLQLAFTPSHLLGVPLVLLVVLLCRHMIMRPSVLIAGVLGLLLGSISLVAEWYFLPLVSGLTLVLLAVAWRDPPGQRRLGKHRFLLALLPAVVAVFWGTFNNTYLAGTFGDFWMRYDTIETLARTRQYEATFGASPSAPPPPAATTVPMAPAGYAYAYQPKWTVPDLVPLRLNFAHLGRVPSWNSTGSDESSYIPIFSATFFMEAAPVLLVGLPFGLWLAWRRRDPIVILLAWLATICVIPPIFLDWGYRSTDFLRFFTASYSFSALFLGWAAGSLLTKSTAPQRFLGGLLAASCLINPIGLGIVGLMPNTIGRVNLIASTARSLSDASSDETANSREQAVEQADQAKHRAFEKLAVATGDFLYPLGQGRDRVIVIVPSDEVPKVKYFPEWMKMATLSRVLLPVGWHWNDSIYAGYYRDAVERLDNRAIVALDAKWIIVSNLFQEDFPRDVVSALNDQSRFAPQITFHEGRYYMTVFRVLPRSPGRRFSAAP